MPTSMQSFPQAGVVQEPWTAIFRRHLVLIGAAAALLAAAIAVSVM
jgi:hypothetical protein